MALYNRVMTDRRALLEEQTTPFVVDMSNKRGQFEMELV